MCGIVGKLSFHPEREIPAALVSDMLLTIAHRGPDADQVYVSGPIGLGHRRLSIIDLAAGTQPMSNEDDSLWIVFNGEIYNFRELRKELVAKGHQFKTQSDTEVILHLYEDLGEACVKRLTGMFAFAIWSERDQSLFIARDRLGIKPLYYRVSDSDFWFGSEIKAILADPSVPRNVDLSSLRSFFSFGFIPGQETPLAGIRKLLPGHCLKIERGQMRISEYWDLRYSSLEKPFESACEQLEQLLAASVKDHLIADVPVGVLLSGGVDSTAVLSLASRVSDRPLKTFTVGFDGNDVVDERPFAKIAASRYGSEHYDLSLTADQFWAFLPKYVWHMEEWVHEPPAAALHYVSEYARRHVKVLLSGEGGDEAFGGYPNYPNTLRAQRYHGMLGPLSRPAGGVASMLGAMLHDPRLMHYGSALGRPVWQYYFSRASGPTSFFNRKARHIFTDEFLTATNPDNAGNLIEELGKKIRDEQLLNQMLYIDTKTWLPDDLLVKADKITMANSLELRVPLLDHRIVEFAAALPVDYKVSGNQTKRILKAALEKLVPREVVERKKAGFPVPYARWLRNELRSRVEEVLLDPRSLARGYLKPNAVHELLQNNVREGRHSREIFCLLTLELWHRAGFL